MIMSQTSYRMDIFPSRTVTGGGQSFTNGQRQKKTSHPNESAAFERQHRQSPQRSRRSGLRQDELVPATFRVPHLTTSVVIAGVEKLMRMYSGNPTFSNQKNLEETEQQLDEVKDSACREDRQEAPGRSRLLLLPAVLLESGPSPGHALQAVCGVV